MSRPSVARPSIGHRPPPFRRAHLCADGLHRLLLCRFGRRARLHADRVHTQRPAAGTSQHGGRSQVCEARWCVGNLPPLLIAPGVDQSASWHRLLTILHGHIVVAGASTVWAVPRCTELLISIEGEEVVFRDLYQSLLNDVARFRPSGRDGVGAAVVTVLDPVRSTTLSGAAHPCQQYPVCCSKM